MAKRQTADVVIAPDVVDANRRKIDASDLQQLTDRRDEIAAHVAAAIARSPLTEHPFPHALMAPALPEWLYEMVRRAWPSPEFFAQPAPSRRILDLGPGHGSFALLPDTLRQFWETLQAQVLQQAMGAALVDRYGPYFDAKFRPLLSGYTDGEWRRFGLEFERAGLMIHAPGFELKPHIDSPRYAVVYLLYCPPDDSEPQEGTDLYEMEGDSGPQQSLRTRYPEIRAGLRPVVSLPYRRNSLATFLVADRSLHGVTIKRLDDRRVINCAIKLPAPVLDRVAVA